MTQLTALNLACYISRRSDGFGQGVIPCPHYMTFLSGALGAIMGTGGGDYNACANDHRTFESLSSFSSS